MGIRDYLAIFGRHWLSIVGLTLIGGLLALAVSLLSPRVYTATAQNFVSIGGNSQGVVTSGSSFALQRVKSYLNVVDSASVLAPVVSQLQLEMTPQQLAGMVSASNPPQTVLINVSATGGDPVQVADIANAVAVRLGDVIEILETPNGSEPPVKVSTIVQAVAPTSPASPRTTVNLALGMLLGLGAGIAWAFLRDRTDTSVRSLDKAADAAAAPGLGTVPAQDDPLPALSATSEAYRTLRTNLTFIDVDNPPRVIAVVSAEPEEGKTTTATNLAIALAQAGSSVCLVEADLRRPGAADRMGVSSSIGLTSVLAGNVELPSALVPWRRGLLTLLPAGEAPPNPSELLGSASFAAVIATLRESFDMVIVDAAPLLPVADGALVSRAADGALLIARYGRTSAEGLGRARETLDRVGARLLGVVLNAIPVVDLPKGTGYGYTPRVEDVTVGELLR